MYAHHFGLHAEPFALSPDPAFLYLSPSHANAFAAVKVGLIGRQGLTVMTGEVGTGKTTLLYALLSQLGPELRTAYIANTRLPFDDLLRQACADFGIVGNSSGRLDLLRALNLYLLQCHADGVTAALVIDEAQDLDDDAFENLRLVSNFETFDAKLLQILLVGQPELLARLAQPNLRQVAERVAVCSQVQPLTRRQGRAYIAHRLRCAGGSVELFGWGALPLVLWKARGIPRRINIICQNAFLFAYGAGATQVSMRSVRAAARAREEGGLTNIRGRHHRPATSLPVAAATPSGPTSRAPKFRLRPVWAGVAAGSLVIGTLAVPDWKQSAAAQGLRKALASMTREVVFSQLRPHPDSAESATSAPRDAGDVAARLTGVESQLSEEAIAALRAHALQPGAEHTPRPDPVAGGSSAETVVASVAEDASAPALPVPAPETAPAPPVMVDAPHPDTPAAAADHPGIPAASKRPALRVVHVAPGDTLFTLTARVYGRADEDLLRRIRRANPQIVDPDFIFAGTALRFPMADAAASHDSEDDDE
jgi:type II secretory pathway predicted ATPase ExeA/phage tail protein X